LFALTAQDYSISSKQIQGVMRSFVDEQNVIGKEVFSAFGLQAAITRFGQTQDDDEWVRLDEVAGSIVNLTTSQWDAMLNRARHISVKAIESLVGQAA
jgi:hypothetical protein